MTVTGVLTTMQMISSYKSKLEQEEGGLEKGWKDLEKTRASKGRTKALVSFEKVKVQMEAERSNHLSHGEDAKKRDFELDARGTVFFERASELLEMVCS